jgi:hypothetical protein
MKPSKESPKEEPLSCYHFNIKCEGGIVFNRVRVNWFKDMRPEIIASAWCVEVRRELTREEIKKLCAASWIKERIAP